MTLYVVFYSNSMRRITLLMLDLLCGQSCSEHRPLFIISLEVALIGQLH